MNKIIITANSGSDPVDESLDKMVSGFIHQVNEKNEKEIDYRDIREINPDDIIENRKHGALYRTSSPSIEDCLKMFETHASKGDEVIHFPMSYGISDGSTNAAILAADTINRKYGEKIHIFDSITGAAGGTLITEYAKMLADEGMDCQTIIQTLEILKHNIVSSYYVPDVSGFLFSGRHNSAYDKIGKRSIDMLTKFGIKMRVDFNDNGNLFMKKIYRGKAQPQLENYVHDLVNKDNIETFDSNFFTILHMPIKDTNPDIIVKYINNLNYFKNIKIQRFNGVYTAYGCEDLYSMSVMKKPDKPLVKIKTLPQR